MISETEGLLAEIRDSLDRIAAAQEGMLAIAAEARQERLELSQKMKQHFKAGFQGENNERSNDSSHK